MHLYTAASHMVHRSLRLDPLLTRKDCGNAEWPSLLAHVTSSYNINSTIGPSQRSHHLVLPAIPGHIIICCHLQNSLQTYHSLIWHAHRSRIGTDESTNLDEIFWCRSNHGFSTASCFSFASARLMISRWMIQSFFWFGFLRSLFSCSRYSILPSSLRSAFLHIVAGSRIFPPTTR